MKEGIFPIMQDELGKQIDDNLTYGLELEFCDCDRSVLKLPNGATWNKKEVTLVNSNGVAVNSKSKIYTIGGEVNTPPTNTILEQFDICQSIFDVVAPHSTVNYRCNTHIHVGFKEPLTLEQMKLIAKYAYENYEEHLKITMGDVRKHPLMTAGFYKKHKEVNLSEHTYRYLMQADSIEGFKQAFFLKKDGTKGSALMFRRSLVNLHSLFKYGTVEFRGFWGTLDANKVFNCMLFCRVFILSALMEAEKIHRQPIPSSMDYPEELPFDPILEQGFRETKINIH